MNFTLWVLQVHPVHTVWLVVAVRGEEHAVRPPACHPQHVVQRAVGAVGAVRAVGARLYNIQIIRSHGHFFTVRLRIDWFIKVVIERLEVVVSGGIERNLLVVLTLHQEVGGGWRPVRGHQRTEGPVIIHLGSPRSLLVFEGEVTEVHGAVHCHVMSEMWDDGAVRLAGPVAFNWHSSHVRGRGTACRRYLLPLSLTGAQHTEVWLGWWWNLGRKLEMIDGKLKDADYWCNKKCLIDISGTKLTTIYW